MKKIIKLNESDLLKIIDKIISEQGLGRRIPSNFGQDIISQVKSNDQNITLIQKKLKDLRYNLGKSGPNGDGVDGEYGRLTRLAVQDFQRKNNLIPFDGIVGPNTARVLGVNSLSKEQIKILKTGGVLKDTPKPKSQPQKNEICPSPKEKENQLSSGFLNRISHLIPSHLRMFLFYLSGRYLPAGPPDFEKDEIDYINKVVNEFCRGKKNCNGNIDFYKNQVDFAKLKQGKEEQFILETPKEIAMTLGNATITDKGDHYLLYDLYDFNNYKRNPENYTLAKLPSTVSAAIKKIFCNNWVQGVEELASYKQAMGYTGFPIVLKIPKV